MPMARSSSSRARAMASWPSAALIPSRQHASASAPRRTNSSGAVGERRIDVASNAEVASPCPTHG